MKEIKDKKQKQKISISVYVTSLLCVGIFCSIGSFLIFQIQQNYKTNQVQASTNGDLSKVDALYTEILDSYVGKVDKKALVDGALKGMTEALGDPYSAYIDEENAKEFNDSISGSFEGIGATLTLENDIVTIADAPIKGSPAEKSGLKAKDMILKVDDEEIKGQPLSEVISKIRGDKGTDVKLNIQRGEENFDVTVTRDIIPLQSVYGELDTTDKTIGNIKITTFSENTTKELKETITDLRNQGAKAFVLDVRRNPGGLLDVVCEMSSMFLEDGKTIVQTEDSNGNTSKTVAGKTLDDGFKVKEPVVVLVDDGSASASEIFAAALKESGNVEIIGKTTFGKGTMQNIKAFSDQSEIKLSVGKWLTPKGEWINEKGVEPTIEADFPEYAYLNPIDTTKEYKQGDANSAIKNSKELLQALQAYSGEINETYDESLTIAVKNFQKENSLEETGTINQQTAIVIEAKLSELIQNNDNAYKEGIKVLEKDLSK